MFVTWNLVLYSQRDSNEELGEVAWQLTQEHEARCIRGLYRAQKYKGSHHGPQEELVHLAITGAGFPTGTL
jgi:hypothetical protein